MRLDWVTVIAQIVNFLVLVWLLERFLYRPVIRAMDRREQRVSGRLQEAARREAEADSQKNLLVEERDQLRREREQELAAARKEAAEERSRLIGAARAEAQRQKQEWERQMQAQRASFLASLRRRTTECLFTAAGRALRDLADADLEEQMAAAFLRKLEELDAETVERLARGLAGAGNAAVVRSRFEIPQRHKEALASVVRRRLSDGSGVQFEVRPQMAGGIELWAGSQIVKWTVESYLENLERTLEEEMDRLEESWTVRKVG